MTRERVLRSYLIVLFISAILFVVAAFVSPGPSQQLSAVLAVGGILVTGLLLYADRRGWRWTAEATVALMVSMISLAADPTYLRDHVALSIFIPVAVAAALLPPLWTGVTFVATLLGMIIRLLLTATIVGPTFAIDTLILAGVTVTGIVLASAVARYERRQAETARDQARTAQLLAEQRAAEATQANNDLADRNEELQAVLNLVQQLELPVVPLADQVLYVPLVGHLDSRRADDLMRRALSGVHGANAALLIIDLAGVTLIDTDVATAVIRAARAVRLLGCQVCLCGLSAHHAMTMTQLGVDLAGDGIVIYRSLQQVIQGELRDGLRPRASHSN